jgi:hypothetical protein
MEKFNNFFDGQQANDIEKLREHAIVSSLAGFSLNLRRAKKSNDYLWLS